MAKSSRLEGILHRLANEYGVTVVAADELLDRSVTVEIYDQPPHVVLDLLARLVTADLSLDGDVWILGAGRPSDRSVLVRRVRGLEPGDVDKVLRVAGLENASLVSLESGLLVFAGRTDLVRRVATLLADIEAIDRPLWAIQLHLVTLSARDLSDLGMDVKPALDVAVGQAIGSADQLEPIRLEAQLRAVLRASQSRGSVSIIAQPVFLVLDGGQAEFKRQRRVPYRTRTVTQSGAVQDSGVSFLSAGTTVSVKVRELSPSKVLLDCDIEVSELGELVADGLPASETRSHKAAGALQDGGCYLLTSIETGSDRSTESTWLSWGKQRDRSQEVLQVWARAVAVSGLTQGNEL